MTRRSIWFSIRNSLWFVPMFLLGAGVALAFVLVELDRFFDLRLLQGLPEILLASPDGAREILTVIAGSMITVAGVVFSVTIVTLVLAANQYSPRVLRSFMRDRLNQTVLGVFVGVFIYSLLVLQSVHSGPQEFVPHLAVWGAITLAVVGIAFFIAFIHHTAASIQAPEIVARICHETLTALEAAQKLSKKGDTSGAEAAAVPDVVWHSIAANRSGYIQDVDVKKLFDIACEQNIVLQVEHAVGDFVVEGRPLVAVGSGEELDEETITKIQRLFGINSMRTVEQDPTFGARQIVDIALKALSPSLNDTTTAVHCVDYLGVILHHALQAAELPQVHRQGGTARLILKQPGAAHLIDVAFHEIRQNADGNVAVILRLLRILRQLLEEAGDDALRKQLRRHVTLVADEAQRNVPAQADRETVMRSVEAAVATAAGNCDTKVKQ